MRAKKSVSMKALVVLLAVVLLIGCTIGGTLAWLAVKTEPVVNTFATSNIDITLTETTEEFKMIPGTDIAKDPVVTVAKGSEPCYVFVKVEADNTENYITYAIVDSWKPVTGTTGVYYQVVNVLSAADDAKLPILVDNMVHVPDTVTKAMMDAAEGNEPKLTFTAYAIQSEGFADEVAAWAEAKNWG